MDIHKNLVLLGFFILCITCCPENCNDCDPSFTVCFACKHGYELSVLGKCVSNTLVDKCTVYGPKNQCFACQPSYELYGGKCVKEYSGCTSKNFNDQSCHECGFGKILVNGICKGHLNCEHQEEFCTACPYGFELANGQCIDKTEGCQSLSKRADGICETCKPGYTMVGYRCVKEQSVMPYCYVNYNEHFCEKCKNGYSLFRNYCLLPHEIQDILTGKISMEKTVNKLIAQMQSAITQSVKNGNQNKDEKTIVTSQGPRYPKVINCVRQEGYNCVECQQGYVPAKGLCVATDPNCGSYEFTTGKCTSCIYGFYLKDSNCLKVSSLCDGYDLMNGNCLGCKNKAMKIKDGKCVDPNCAQSTGQVCTTCVQGFKYNQNTEICQFFDHNCANFKDNVCDSCKPGFYPNTKRICWKLPPNCKFGNVLIEGSCIKCNEKFNLEGNSCQPVPQIKIDNCAEVENGRCQFCNQGFYMQKLNVCLKKSPLCLEYTNGQCSNCVSGYNMKSGICTDLNCLRHGDDGKCIECKKNFRVLPPLNVCLFYDPNCLVLGKGQCQECKEKYFRNLQGLCEKKPEVIQPSFPQQFQSPSKPATIPTVTIVQTQPSQNRDPNCIRYENGKCTQCSNRYYFSSEGRCVPVNPSCKDYNDQGQCTTCFQGYAVIDGLCKTEIDADPKCRRRNSSGQCSQCYDGYFLNGTRCQAVNALCATSNSLGQCLTCFNGFSLINGNCIVTVRDPYCQSYNSATNQCQKCSNKYFFNPTAGKCQAVSSLCKEYNQSNGLCTICFDGFRLNNGVCVVSNSRNSDANCASPGSDGICTACFSGFYVKAGKCEKISPLCNGADLKNGQCKGCFPGYVLDQGQCKIPDPKSVVVLDQNCKQFTDYTRKQCKICYSGFFSKNGVCVQFNPLCQTSNLMTGACESCYMGYGLVNGQCVETKQTVVVNTDVNCYRVKEGVCVECFKGFFLNKNKVCQQNNPYCKTSNQTNGDCTTCYKGYQLDGRGNCTEFKPTYIPFCQSMTSQSTCSECIEGYYVKGNECKPVSILCGGSYDKQTGKCTDCLHGHFLQDGECIYPSLGIDEACNHYTNGFCDRCVQGYFLRNYFCTPITDLCVEFDYQRSLCLKCKNNARPIGADCY